MTQVDARDDAFVAFVRDRGDALSRTACLLAGDVGRGEDVLQTALAATYVRWRDHGEIDSLEAYVRRALVTANAAWWRRSASREHVRSTLPDRVAADHAGSVLDRQVVLAALRHLPPRQRAAVVLRFYDDLTETQTAAVLGCSVGSVKTHTSRGLTRLRELLEHPSAPTPATAERGWAAVAPMEA